jgi:hypothetical protein
LESVLYLQKISLIARAITWWIPVIHLPKADLKKHEGYSFTCSYTFLKYVFFQNLVLLMLQLVSQVLCIQ